MTLHHLLSHTSGVPNELIAAFKKDPSIATLELSTDEAVQRFASGALQFEPGARFDYSHSNWMLVKAVIEKVSGRTYAQELQRVLVTPLGPRTPASSRGLRARAARRAGLRRRAPRAEARRDANPAFVQAAGGFYSTAPDLLTLTRAVYGGKVLSALAEEAHHRLRADEDYSYGGRMLKLPLGGAEK